MAPPVLSVRDDGNRTTAVGAGFGTTPDAAALPWTLRKGSGHMDGEGFVFENPWQEPIATIEVGTGQQHISTELDPGQSVIWRYKDLGNFYRADVYKITTTRQISTPKEYRWEQQWYESPNDGLSVGHGHSYYEWDDQNRFCPHNSPNTLYHSHWIGNTGNYRQHQHPNNGCRVVEERGGVQTVTTVRYDLNVYRYINGVKYGISYHVLRSEHEANRYYLDHSNGVLTIRSVDTGRTILRREDLFSGSADGIHVGIGAHAQYEYVPDENINYFNYDAKLNAPRQPDLLKPYDGDRVDANNLIARWTFNDPDEGAYQLRYSLQVRLDGTTDWFNFDEDAQQLVAGGDDLTVIFNETSLTETDLSGLLDNGERYQMRVCLWDNDELFSGWSAISAFDTSEAPVFTWQSPLDGGSISDRLRPVLEFNVVDPNGDIIDDIEFKVFLQEQYSVPGFSVDNTEGIHSETIQYEGFGQTVLDFQFTNNTNYLLAARARTGPQFGVWAMAFVDVNLRGASPPVIALTHYYEEPKNINFTEIRLRATANLADAQSSEFNQDQTVGAWEAGPGTELLHDPERGYVGASLRLVDDGTAPAYLSALLRGTGAVPGDFLNLMYRLMDSGDRLETQGVIRYFTDQMDPAGEEYISDWEEQLESEVPPEPPPETVQIRYSTSANMQTNPQPLDGLDIDRRIAIFLYGFSSQHNLPAGGRARWYFDNVLVYEDNIAPYQYLGGSASSAVMVEPDDLTPGAHEIKCLYDRDVADPEVGEEEYIANITVTPPSHPKPVFGNSLDAYPNSVTDLNGALLTQPFWIFADMRPWTPPKPVSNIALWTGDPLADPGTWQLLWREVQAPYGDAQNPISFADGDHTVWLEVTYNDATSDLGDPATFNMDSTVEPPDGGGGEPPATGGDLGNGWDKASLLNKRWGYGAKAGTGAMDYEHVVVDTIAELRNAIESGGDKWITGTPGKTISGGVHIDPDHGNFVVDGRACNFVLTASGGSAFELSSAQNRNIILAYITFNKPSSSIDGIRIAGPERSASSAPKDIWCTHITFNGSGDGCLDVTRNGTDCTFDYIRFNDAGKTALWGGDDVSDVSTDTRISAGHIFFNNCNDRQARMRYSKVHYVNCYWLNPNYGIVSSQQAQARADNCVFSGGDNPFWTGKFASDTSAGIGQSFGELLLNGATLDESGTVFTPPYEYDLEPADQALIDKIVAQSGNVK